MSKSKAKEPAPDGTVRITATGRVGMYISYAAGLFNGTPEQPADGDKAAVPAQAPRDTVTISATGNALPKAVQVVEILKRRIKGLHQTSELSSTEVTDEIEKDGSKETKSKFISVMQIVLSKKALAKTHNGYQPPLPESEVEELTAEEMAERGARKRDGPKPKAKKKGKGKGKGKGAKGTAKGKGKGAPKKEEPPAKPARARGGKGAGKGGKAAAEPEKPTRGRGKGRGRGK